MESGAVVAATLQPGARGDTQSLPETMSAALKNMQAVLADARSAPHVAEQPLAELVTDKGYHSNDTMTLAAATETRTYVSEPERGRRDWTDNEEARDATHANRRRIKGRRGRALMRRRGEILERTFAHTLETGGMRRVWLRGRENILKRYLVHVAAFNLSLVMRAIFGVGTPRELGNVAQDVVGALVRLLRALLEVAIDPARPSRAALTLRAPTAPPVTHSRWRRASNIMFVSPGTTFLTSSRCGGGDWGRVGTANPTLSAKRRRARDAHGASGVGCAESRSGFGH
jgi:hypothetical protein